MQQGAGVGKQAVAVGHDEVEQTVAADFMGQASNGVKQNFRFGFGSKAAAQAVENKQNARSESVEPTAW